MPVGRRAALPKRRAPGPWRRGVDGMRKGFLSQIFTFQAPSLALARGVAQLGARLARGRRQILLI